MRSTCRPRRKIIDDFESRLENIREMVFDASRKESLEEYLEDAALLREDQDLSDAKTGVRLSTIHAAKGLEFKVVFVVALEEGILPHSRSIASETRGGGLRRRRRGRTETHVCGDDQSLRPPASDHVAVSAE